MNVYPVNAIDAANLMSLQRATHSSLNDLYNRYIDFQVDFNSAEIELSGLWTSIIPVNAFIIGNTNARFGTVRYYHDAELLFEQRFNINSFLTIIQNVDAFKKLITKEINHFSLQLQGNENISIGYIFIGETWELPRFIVSPSDSLQLRNESSRTFSGQVTGIPKVPLRAFGISNVRIDNKTKKLYDNYINGVQTVIPHVIDPYPEVHDEYEPFFATVAEYSPKEKRNENDFYWNFSCSWQEAK